MDLPTDSKIDVLVSLYRQAELELQVLVERALSSGALSTAVFRQGQLAQVEEILSALQDEAVPQATSLVVESYQLGLGIGGESEGALGPGVHQQAMEILADSLVEGLNSAAETVGRRVDDVFRKEGLRVTALSLAEGLTGRQAAQRLRETLEAQGVTAFRDKSGREWGLEQYASMATRTTTREAATTGTTNRLLENGTDLVEVALSDEACPQCVREYKGKAFSLTGKTEGYPVLKKPPPLHPNDRCVVVPARANFEALERELLG